MREACSIAMRVIVGGALGLGGCGEPGDDAWSEEDAPLAAELIDANLGREPGDAGSDAAVDGGGGQPSAPLACSDLFDPAQLRTYEVQMTEAELQKMNDEFLRPVLNEDESGYLHPYHPIVLKLGDETRTDAMIRLKGDSSWEETVRRDRNPKAQFVIAFDKVNKGAPFHGLDKIEFDMPRTDPTFLRERVGNQVMRDLGLGGVCGASARINLNGKYYGLYVAQEDVGKRVLRRIYPEAPKGALWKSGYELESDATPAERTRQIAWEKATTIPAMRSIIDLEQAVYEWAAEIALNNADGYYGGDHNFYIYDHPGKGFQWLPTDLDSTFDYLPPDIHPIYWWEDHDSEQTAGQHYRAVITDPVWRRKLVDAVGKVLGLWNAPRIQSLIDAWSTQVSTSVRDDPHRSFTVTASANATAELRQAVQLRADYLRGWLQCERTNVGTDADRDGSPWCKDCNDRRALVRPGAREICRNDRDDNCNGLRDEGCLSRRP